MLSFCCSRLVLAILSIVRRPRAFALHIIVNVVLPIQFLLLSTEPCPPDSVVVPARRSMDTPALPVHLSSGNSLENVQHYYHTEILHFNAKPVLFIRCLCIHLSDMIMMEYAWTTRILRLTTCNSSFNAFQTVLSGKSGIVPRRAVYSFAGDNQQFKLSADGSFFMNHWHHHMLDIVPYKHYAERVPPRVSSCTHLHH